MALTVHTWQDLLQHEAQQPYFQNLYAKLAAERAAGATVFPPENQIFHALDCTPFDCVRVVILGQDPYHNVGQAQGLAFSVPRGCKIPPSLCNIYQELSQSIAGFQRPEHGDLHHWAAQGVLLLNSVLTVRAHEAHSHAGYGWEILTDHIIAALNAQHQNLVFLLWGSHAQKKGAHIHRAKHLVLTAPHPSPLSAYRGFIGCRHFVQANHYLQENHFTAIDWQL